MRLTLPKQAPSATPTAKVPKTPASKSTNKRKKADDAGAENDETPVKKGRKTTAKNVIKQEVEEPTNGDAEPGATQVKTENGAGATEAEAVAENGDAGEQAGDEAAAVVSVEKS